MSSRFCIVSVIVFFSLILSANLAYARRQQKRPTADQDQIVDTISTLFTAIGTDDVAKFNSVTASDFYIFDGGVRFNGEDLIALIKAQHAAGKRYEWNVTEPEVRVSCNTAWIAYTNKGSITDSSGTVNQKWLESAFLEKQAGNWKIVFMHSSRVPTQPQETHDK